MAIKKENRPKAGFGKITISLVMTLLLALSVASCTKDPKEDPKPTSSNDVYVAGEESDGTSSIPKLWKNGVATSIAVAGSFSPQSLFVDDNNDVYVLGVELVGSKFIVKYWKNGVMTVLPTDIDTTVPTCIAVYKSDVYVAALTIVKGNPAGARLWKNGIRTDYNPTVLYLINGFGVSAGEFIIMGKKAEAITGAISKTYIKNGIEISLPSDITNLVAGPFDGADPSDFYNGSKNKYSAYTSFKSGLKDVAVVAKNDTEEITNLTDGTLEASANSVYVKYDTTYVAGYENNTAKYWKGKTGVNLTDGKYSSVAYAIFVK